MLIGSMSELLKSIHGSAVELAWMVLIAQDEMEFYRDVRHFEEVMADMRYDSGSIEEIVAAETAIKDSRYPLALTIFYEQQRCLFEDILGPYIYKRPHRQVSHIPSCLCVSYD